MDLHQPTMDLLKLHSFFYRFHTVSIQFLVRFGGEETYGGNAVAYRSSLRIAVRPLEPLGSWNGPKDVKAVRTMLEVVSTALVVTAVFFGLCFGDGDFGAEMEICENCG